MIGALPIVHSGKPGKTDYYNIEVAQEEGNVSTGHQDTSKHVGILMVIGLLILIALNAAGFADVSVKAGTKIGR